MASKDASFQAYMALYNAGLVNDNLLPLLSDYQEEEDAATTRDFESVTTVAELVNPWVQMAHNWRNATTLHRTLVQVCSRSGEIAILRVLLPCALPQIPPFPLYWERNTQYQASLETMGNEDGHILKPLYESLARSLTYTLYRAAIRARLSESVRDFTVLWMLDLPITVASGKIGAMVGEYPATELTPLVFPAQNSWGIIRDQTRYGAAHRIIRTLLGSQMQHYELPGDAFDAGELVIVAERISKRMDFLHRIPEQDQEVPFNLSFKTPHLLRAKDCTVDRLPANLGRFARMLPSVLHMFELYLIAERLQTTLLSPLNLTSLDNILTAICASSAQEHVDYQRLEFLGDCVLKLHTTIDLMNAHPTWPESYLTKKKSALVSNQALAKAAVAAGLDSFIVTKKFTGHKWLPHYNSELLRASSQGTRQMSTKILADVVEALIGAAYLDGTSNPLYFSDDTNLACLDPSGLAKAVECASLLMPRLLPILDLSFPHPSLSLPPRPAPISPTSSASSATPSPIPPTSSQPLPTPPLPHQPPPPMSASSSSATPSSTTSSPPTSSPTRPLCRTATCTPSAPSSQTQTSSLTSASSSPWPPPSSTLSVSAPQLLYQQQSSTRYGTTPATPPQPLQQPAAQQNPPTPFSAPPSPQRSPAAQHTPGPSSRAPAHPSSSPTLSNPSSAPSSSTRVAICAPVPASPPAPASSATWVGGWRRATGAAEQDAAPARSGQVCGYFTPRRSWAGWLETQGSSMWLRRYLGLGSRPR